MDANDLDLVRNLVLRRSGIVLDRGKEYLVEARLTALARKDGLKSVDQLVAALRRSGLAAAEAERAVVGAMTTNETSFFRDVHPFEVLQKHVLPDLIARRAGERRLSVWCAASSTGQEPYTIAMTLREHFPQLATWDVRFVASDLSGEVLARARAGRFSQIEVNRGLPARLLVKYFRKCETEWEISPELRQSIDFREVNLLEAWPAMPPPDVIFLRNVLIYFGDDLKRQIFQRVRRFMRPDGFLFLGGAETTLNLDDQLERAPFDKSGCYQVRGRPAAAPRPGAAPPTVAAKAARPAA